MRARGSGNCSGSCRKRHDDPAHVRSLRIPIGTVCHASNNIQDGLQVALLLAALQENIATLPPQTADYILTQVNTDPTSPLQRNVIEIRQRPGNVVSFTVQSR
jgi:hypothetical protein